MTDLHIILLGLATLIAVYFTLIYFWVYPDAWSRGQNPRDWAISGAFLIVVFNFVGFLFWILLYLDGRKRGPGFSLLREQPKYQKKMFYPHPKENLFPKTAAPYDIMA